MYLNQPSGTSDPLKLKLTGSEGSTDWMDLENPDNDKFSSGQLSTFTMMTKPLGDLSQLQVKHEGTGGWMMVEVGHPYHRGQGK